MVDETKIRRTLIIGKIREGLDRIAREHPGLNWQYESSELSVATETLENSMVAYIQLGAPIEQVRGEFVNWERVFINQPREGMLFG